MRNVKLVSAVALMTLSVCMGARAAAPTLPPEAVAADTVAVIHLESTHFTPDALRMAAQALLGPNAQRVNDSLTKFEDRYNKAKEAGVQSMTLTMSSSKPSANAAGAADAANPAGAQGSEPKGIAYLELKPGADVNAVEKIMQQEMDPAKREQTEFKKQGNYLAMYQKGQTLPTHGDVTRSTQFANALGSVSNAAVQIAFIPDAATKTQMMDRANGEGAPAGAKEAMPVLANSKWITLAVNFGNAPGVTATASTADADSAKKLVEDINKGLTEMKQSAANGGGQGPAAMFGPLAGQLAQGLTPTQNGNDVSVSLSGQPLKMVAGFVAMIAGGAPGGPGAGPGGPGASPARPAPVPE